MICKVCGAQIDEGGRFCASCGAPVEQPVQPIEQPVQPIEQPVQPIEQPVQPIEQPQYQQAPQNGQPQYQQYQQYQQPINPQAGYAKPKSRVAAGILGILLGGLGVHNFYLGYTGKAIAQLLISLLSCGILAIVSSIWGLVEGIMILTGNIAVDGHGLPLGE